MPAGYTTSNQNWIADPNDERLKGNTQNSRAVTVSVSIPYAVKIDSNEPRAE